MNEERVKKLQETFSKRLDVLMDCRFVSQQDLASKIGVSRATVWRWCNGVSLPNIRDMFRLCLFFDASLTDLTGFGIFVAASDGINPIKKTDDESKLCRLCGVDLKTRLAEKGKTALDMANDLDISTSVISRWITGQRWPSVISAIRVCNWLDVCPYDLWSYGIE